MPKVAHVYFEPASDAEKYISALKKNGISFENKKVLDIGSGTGVYASTIATFGCHNILGIDIEPENVKIAQDRFGNDKIEFRCMDFDKENITDRKFDLLFARGVIYYFDNPVDFIKKIDSYLLPGGECFISMIEKNNVAMILNIFKKISAGVPDKIKPLYKTFLSIIYKVLNPKTAWNVIEWKMNTIFFPAKTLFLKKQIEKLKIPETLEIKKVLDKKDISSKTDFAVIYRKINL